MARIIWAQKEFNEKTEEFGIFLAGPTLRKPGHSWRRDAFDFFKDMENVVLYVPEPENWGSFAQLENSTQEDYDRQVEWEQEALRRSDAIVFWVPRDLEEMPAFTTNIEFGMWHNSPKVTVGWPEGAPKMKYFDFLARKLQKTVYHTLEDTLKGALSYRDCINDS